MDGQPVSFFDRESRSATNSKEMATHILEDGMVPDAAPGGGLAYVPLSDIKSCMRPDSMIGIKSNVSVSLEDRALNGILR